MKCLRKYQWVKLPRASLPQGKGVMGYWAKLASRAAFRKGQAIYCGYTNEVVPGMWSGGIIGLKSILGLKSRAQVLSVMDELSELGYIHYTLDKKTKKLKSLTEDFSFLIFIGFYSVCFLLKITVAVSFKKWDKSQTVFS